MTETQASIEQWRAATFGADVPLRRSALRLAARANLEMAELIDALSVSDNNPAAAAEVADVVIVLMGVASLLGVDLLEEVDKKMAINRARQWSSGRHVSDGVMP